VVILDVTQYESGKFDVLRRFGQHRGAGGKNAKSMDVDDDEEEVVGGESEVETIAFMAVSADGLWLATGDLKNRIFVFNLDTLQVSDICSCFLVIAILKFDSCGSKSIALFCHK
jgi:U3 small nucleolar RNA-associated protein 4